MSRSERRAQLVRMKAKAKKKLTRFQSAPDARQIGRAAAMHGTCDCWLCATPELRHRRPKAKSVDPEQKQDWVNERRCDLITGDAQVHQISPGQQP